MRKAAKVLFLLLVCALALAILNGVFFRKQINLRPLPSHYKKGVYHLHSRFSDGLGSAEDICRAASALGLDFVILTDHGRPNLGSSAATAWRQGTLLIGASEFSLHAGHLAAAGYSVPGYAFPPEAQEAIDEVARDQGVTFISHPLDGKIPWTDWQVRGFTGIEILSLYQLARKNAWYGLTLFPLQYLLSPDFALTALISYPRQELEIWDRFNRQGKYFGIYALDTHAKLPIGKKASLHFPSYAATFRILNIYARVDGELQRDAQAAAEAVIASLRRGSFFSVIESLAAANGFECYYREPDGGRVEMGGDARRPGGTLVLELPFAIETDIVVRRDGVPFREIRGNDRRRLELPVPLAGVYRCEIFLHGGRFRKLPWILANPVFVARPQPAAPPAPPLPPRTRLNPAAGFFQIEKNGRSLGALSAGTAPDGSVTTRFAFSLLQEAPDIVDYWVALARRGNHDFSAYRGFTFAARGSRPLRFWMQYRTGSGGEESAFQHSFRVDEQWRQIAIPFDRFRRLYGSDSPPDMARVSSFFILIDNGNSFSGARGELELGPLGLY